jgi:glycosyltransferase involved in cell wall biosynthesis
VEQMMNEGGPDCSTLSVAFFLKSLNAGGAERVALKLAIEMSRKGYRPIFVLVNSDVCPSGDLSTLLPSEIEVVDLCSRRTASSLIGLARLLRRRRPTALISFLSQPNLVAICARWLAHVDTQIIISQHNSLSLELSNSPADPRPRLNRWVERLAHRLIAPMADRIVSVSRGVAEDMASCAGYRRDRIEVIPNPVVSRDLTEMAAAEVDHPFFNSTIPVFVGVGRLVAEKDFATLLQAFQHLRKKCAARLALVGDGPLRVALEETATALGVRDDVAFLGFRTNPYPFIKRAAALVLASHYEGFGNVLVEALALGTSVVSTDCPHGPAEILEHGRFGLLVPVGDAEAMASAMWQVLNDPTPKGLSFERANSFTVSRISRRYLEMIEDACKGPPERQPSRTGTSDHRRVGRL